MREFPLARLKLMTARFRAALTALASGFVVAAWPMNFSLAEATAAMDSGTPDCKITLNVSGGVFEPDFCQFEIISGGRLCPRGTQCKPGYAISLKKTALVPGEIESLVLFQIADLVTGAYRFDRTAGPEEFLGELTDKGSILRHLLSGVLELDMQPDGMIRIAADLHFSNDISVTAAGMLGVKRVNAP